MTCALELLKLLAGYGMTWHALVCQGVVCRLEALLSVVVSREDAQLHKLLAPLLALQPSGELWRSMREQENRRYGGAAAAAAAAASAAAAGDSDVNARTAAAEADSAVAHASTTSTVAADADTAGDQSVAHGCTTAANAAAATSKQGIAAHNAELLQPARAVEDATASYGSDQAKGAAAVSKHPDVAAGGAAQHKKRLGACVVCGTKGKMLRCARCLSATYCSGACQKAAWPTHKTECRAKQ